MATSPKVLAPDPEPDKRKRTRSPAFPFITLETAIARAEEFLKKEDRNAAPMKAAVKHWGYEEKSSGGLQTAAALVAFGLLKDEGIGDKRRLQLTPEALRILLDKRPDSEERIGLLKQLALRPRIHQEMWKRWQNKLPSQETLKLTLLTDWKPPFNQNAVDGFIKEYKDTIAFAKLSESDRVTLEVQDNGGEGQGEYVPKVGDYVQWESQGVYQFRGPKAIQRLSDDGKFAFFEGSYTGAPIEQLRAAKAPTIAHVTPVSEQRLPPPPKMLMQEFVVPLGNGTTRAVFQWPTSLSKEDVEDLKDSLKMLERKISRPTVESADRETKATDV